MTSGIRRSIVARRGRPVKKKRQIFCRQTSGRDGHAADSVGTPALPGSVISRQRRHFRQQLLDRNGTHALRQRKRAVAGVYDIEAREAEVGERVLNIRRDPRRRRPLDLEADPLPAAHHKKTLGLRLKARGARWRKRNAVGMSALGCVRHSSQWSSYWAT